MNFLDDTQPCPTCRQHCNYEHFAWEFVGKGQDEAITYLYCEWCERGWESLWNKIAGRWRHIFTVNHGPHEPGLFAKFKENLNAARSVAA